MIIDSLIVRCRVFYPITDIGTLCLAGAIIIGTNNKGGGRVFIKFVFPSNKVV